VRPHLKEYARERATQLIALEPHLDVDTLDAYHRGRLNRDAVQAARFHIVLCADCRELLRGYLEFLEDEPRQSRVGLAELMAAWEELRHEDAPDGKASQSKALE
jgi:hypothetical protein